jgi:uncharacterized metal-binding protein YceD (DUF177 family)
MQVEFHRPVATNRLKAEESVHHIRAEPAEREALARRFGLEALDSLDATVRLRRVRGDRMVRLDAEFSAEVVQTCVATLEPFASRIEDSFTLYYAPPKERAEEAEIVVSMEDAEAPEPLIGETIDIGEAVAQELSLALDPYPRAPQARVDPEAPGSEDSSDRNRPFSDLGPRIKKKP